jgi:hypothetical protein
MPPIPSLRELSRQAVAAALAPPACETSILLLDATAGNGHDTVFLARLAAKFQAAGGGQALVHAFDVQALACARTAERLTQENLSAYVRIHQQGHEHAAETLASLHGSKFVPPLQAMMFNLGYLPAANRRLTTQAATTLTALETLLSLLAPGGLASIHMYAGHANGKEESEAVKGFIAGLSNGHWLSALYQYPNKIRNPEYLALVCRKAG